MFKKILVPIDIAEPAVAEAGVFLAAQLAALADGVVRMIHVFPEFSHALQELLPGHVAIDRENAAGSLLQEIAVKANIPVGRFHAMPADWSCVS